MCLLIDNAINLAKFMTKFIKITVAITLFLFMGQSYATLIMSCDISNSHNANSTSVKSDHVNSADAHPGHKANHTATSGVSLKSLPDQSNCDSEQHSCQCTFGACSTLFLLVDSYHLEYSQDNRLSQSHKSLSSFQTSSLYRPPISA